MATELWIWHYYNLLLLALLAMAVDGRVIAQERGGSASL
jgi:hypothetical protein